MCVAEEPFADRRARHRPQQRRKLGAKVEARERETQRLEERGALAARGIANRGGNAGEVTTARCRSPGSRP